LVSEPEEVLVVYPLAEALTEATETPSSWVLAAKAVPTAEVASEALVKEPPLTVAEMMRDPALMVVNTMVLKHYS
jgi:hypothetical protein